MRVLITSPVFPPDLGGPAVYVPSIANFLDSAAPAIPVSVAGSLDTAVAEAFAAAIATDAPPESVILLSPACASFDQFASFGARGDAFRSLAQTAIADAEGIALGTVKSRLHRARARLKELLPGLIGVTR